MCLLLFLSCSILSTLPLLRLLLLLLVHGVLIRASGWPFLMLPRSRLRYFIACVLMTPKQEHGGRPRVLLVPP